MNIEYIRMALIIFASYPVFLCVFLQMQKNYCKLFLKEYSRRNA